MRNLIFLLIFFSVGCAATTPMDKDMALTNGPRAVTSIKTPYDDLLTCLSVSYKGKQASIGVGAISDETGKFSIGEGGNGKYVTQGAGDMAQVALMQTGIVQVVNRRDPRVMDMESQHGRQMQWIPSDYHITGSINSLDFLPGGGIDANVYGVGAKYRQHRILVGMDIYLTNTVTSEVVGSSSIFKQVVADEVGAGVGRFFGDILVSLDVGQQNREAIHFVLRNMIKLAIYERVSELYNVQENGCSGILNGSSVQPELSVEPFNS